MDEPAYVEYLNIYEDGLRKYPTEKDAGKLFASMSNQLMPANSALLGVALVIRSRDGPRFVFNYPPRLTNPDIERPRWGTELDPTTPDASDDSDIEGDDLEEGGFRDNGLKQEKRKRSRHVSRWDGDEHFNTDDGVHVVPWEHLDAFPKKDLASILTPLRHYHKKCFELSLDPVYYVTYPMHIREDGRWKKAKRAKKGRKKKQRDEDADTDTDLDSVVDKLNLETKEDGKDENGGSSKGPTQMPAINSFASDVDETGGMTMFNLVFIMNPIRMEAPTRIKDMLDHVAKDLNKALRFAQHYSNYVWKESELIMNLKSQAREDRLNMSVLWKTILERSSLAQAIKETYEAISTNRIATVRFNSNPPVRLSIQIPKPYYLTAPPRPYEEAMPGLWITTANCLGDPFSDDTNVLSKHFALLLLDDEAKIIADIQADGGELANPLLEYLKVLKPTLSFQQTAQAHGISLSDIRVLAQHLIYYRRAMAIPPLHGRDIYVLSPNSDNHLLPSASIAWRKAFPLQVPLTTFLATVSTPRRFKSWAPSKNHQPVYIEMLAWLMRHGWVTQLRTFACIIVWPEIVYEVQYALDQERIRSTYEDAVRDAIDEARADASTESLAGSLSTEQTAEKARLARSREKAKQDFADFHRRPKPVSTNNPSTNDTMHVLREQPFLITDPAKPDHKVSLYLEAISKRFGDPLTRKMWKRFVKYFDMETALEDIALLEGLRRKEAWGLVGQFDEFLLTTRRW